MRNKLISIRLPQSLSILLILLLAGGYAFNRIQNRNTWAVLEDPQGRFSISYPAYWQARSFQYGHSIDDEKCAMFYDRPMFASNSLNVFCRPEDQTGGIEEWGLEILDRRSNISRIGQVYVPATGLPYPDVRARDYDIGSRKLRQVYIPVGDNAFIISHDLADRGDSDLQAIMDRMLASFEIQEQ